MLELIYPICICCHVTWYSPDLAISYTIVLVFVCLNFYVFAFGKEFVFVAMLPYCHSCFWPFYQQQDLVLCACICFLNVYVFASIIKFVFVAVLPFFFFSFLTLLSSKILPIVWLQSQPSLLLLKIKSNQT